MQIVADPIQVDKQQQVSNLVLPGSDSVDAISALSAVVLGLEKDPSEFKFFEGSSGGSQVILASAVNPKASPKLLACETICISIGYSQEHIVSFMGHMTERLEKKHSRQITVKQVINSKNTDLIRRALVADTYKFVILVFNLGTARIEQELPEEERNTFNTPMTALIDLIHKRTQVPPVLVGIRCEDYAASVLHREVPKTSRWSKHPGGAAFVFPMSHTQSFDQIHEDVNTNHSFQDIAQYLDDHIFRLKE